MTHKEKCKGEKFQISSACADSLGFSIAHFTNGVSDMRTFKKRFYKSAQLAIEAIARKFPASTVSQIVLD